MTRHAACHVDLLDISMSDHDVKHGRHCPECAAAMDDASTTCWACGHQITTSEPAPENRELDQIPLVDWKEPEPPVSCVQPRESVSAGQSKTWSLPLVGVAATFAIVATIVVVMSRQPSASEQPVAVAAPVASAPAPVGPVAAGAAVTPVPAAPVVESAPEPKWVGARQATWSNDGSRTISFELQSTNDVDVWMKRVRPLLVVRCLYRTTEVFVATRSAASIEAEGGSHTVRLQIDDDPELIQQWSDSVTGQELFASDSVALARRLATAQRLRFSFTPYNAKPVAAEFVVTGFDALAPLVGKTCGWKMDQGRAAQVARHE
jgi:hypothetical protein